MQAVTTVYRQQVFETDGSCIACISSCSTFHPTLPFSPPPADNFSNPAGVCCDVSGNVFVADHGRHRVAMFNNNWQFQRYKKASDLSKPEIKPIELFGRVIKQLFNGLYLFVGNVVNAFLPHTGLSPLPQTDFKTHGLWRHLATGIFTCPSTGAGRSKSSNTKSGNTCTSLRVRSSVTLL